MIQNQGIFTILSLTKSENIGIFEEQKMKKLHSSETSKNIIFGRKPPYLSPDLKVAGGFLSRNSPDV